MTTTWPLDGALFVTTEFSGKKVKSFIAKLQRWQHNSNMIPVHYFSNLNSRFPAAHRYASAREPAATTAGGAAALPAGTAWWGQLRKAQHRSVSQGQSSEKGDQRHQEEARTPAGRCFQPGRPGVCWRSFVPPPSCIICGTPWWGRGKQQPGDQWKR